MLLLNLVFFIIPVCGASVFALIVYRMLRYGAAPTSGGLDGGTEVELPRAGPDDLASSA